MTEKILEKADHKDQPEVLTATEARQGFRGRRGLRILLSSLALTFIAGVALYFLRGWLDI